MTGFRLAADKQKAASNNAIFVSIVLFAACGNSTPASNEAATTDAAPAAAQSEEAAPQPETLSDKTLTVVLQNEPTALTGLLGSGTESGLIIMDTMVNTLYRYEGETRQAVPALASGYETIDELHYRFTLRDDACYSDGTPVKARMSSTASPSTLSPASPMPVTLTWKA